ncbi:MAG: J domain-containing protein [Proteobacteria bacterium]|nr:J domain-containing protein [Pseudomonadota bacterium]
MITFQRIFQKRQQAMDVYKTQLAAQKLYVESFEGYSKGSEVEVQMEIRETGQKVKLNGTVERMVSKKEAMELGYGQRPGLLVNIVITPEIVEPLRTFFLTEAKTSESSRPSEVVRPAGIVRPAGVVRPAGIVRPAGMQPVSEPVEPGKPPLENINKCSPEQAKKEVKDFLGLAETGNIYQLFNLRSQPDRKTLRSIYNTVVRTLHPDSQDEGFSTEVTDMLDEAYQIFNEAYKILQNPVQSQIYQEVSRAEGRSGGLSLNAYRKWNEDYRLRNAANIRLSDELAEKAETALANKEKETAAQNIRLALQYDPYNEKARSIQIKD